MIQPESVHQGLGLRMSGQCLNKSLQISSLQGKYALLPVFCQCIVLKVNSM